MRRDYFTVEVTNGSDGDDIAAISIQYDGPAGEVQERLKTESGTLDADEIDVAFRRQPERETGVLSITDRLTGEYVLEANVDFDAIRSLVTTVEERADDDGTYQIRVTDSDGKSLVYEKHTLLVYDADGSLLRQYSLIPGSVEL